MGTSDDYVDYSSEYWYQGAVSTVFGASGTGVCGVGESGAGVLSPDDLEGMIYLICYDIVENRTRLKVSKLLDALGFRVQKSVFECKLTEFQCRHLQEKIRRLIDLKVDQVRFYPLNGFSEKKIVVLGFQPTDSVRSTYFIS